MWERSRPWEVTRLPGQSESSCSFRRLLLALKLKWSVVSFLSSIAFRSVHANSFRNLLWSAYVHGSPVPTQEAFCHIMLTSTSNSTWETARSNTMTRSSAEVDDDRVSRRMECSWLRPTVDQHSVISKVLIQQNTDGRYSHTLHNGAWACLVPLPLSAGCMPSGRDATDASQLRSRFRFQNLVIERSILDLLKKNLSVDVELSTTILTSMTCCDEKSAFPLLFRYPFLDWFKLAKVQ